MSPARLPDQDRRRSAKDAHAGHPPPPELRISPAALCLIALLLLTSAPAFGLALQRAPQESPTGHPLQRPGYLGVSLRDLDAAETARLQRHPGKNGLSAPDSGAMIVTVDRDAPAWTSGLRPHDVVLELNGQPVDDVEILRHRLRNLGSGETLTLRLWRAGREMTVAVTLGDQDAIAQNAMNRHLRPGSSNSSDTAAFYDGQPPPTDTAAAATSQPPRSMASTLLDALMPSSLYTGLEVTPLTQQLARYFGTTQSVGLLVTAVNAGSPAKIAGLTAGDVLLRVGNRQLSSRNGLARAVRAAHGGAISLDVLHNHQEMSLSLQPAKRR